MNKIIEKNSPLPLYYQLKQIIVEMIENRELNENEKLLTEKEICEKYDISRATVRQAFQELENEDYIYKIQGKGTFVSPKRFEQNLLKFYSFTDEMKKIGKVPQSKVLDFTITQANDKVKNILNINGTKVFKFTRLRLADNEPMMIETTFLPYNLFPNITKEALENKPLYDILIDEYNVVFSKAEEIFRPTLLTEEEAEKLNSIKAGPAIVLERITHDSSNRVIEYTKSIARGDKFKYHVILNK